MDRTDTDNHSPIHGRITGPIVMIGFGSIGKGMLPLIERHFEFDKNRFTVIDPSDKDRGMLDVRGVPLVDKALTPDNYRDILTPLLTRRRRAGVLRERVGGHLLARHHGTLPRARCALRRHRGGALGRLLLRQECWPRGSHQLHAAREHSRCAPQSRRAALRR